MQTCDQLNIKDSSSYLLGFVVGTVVSGVVDSVVCGVSVFVAVIVVYGDVMLELEAP